MRSDSFGRTLSSASNGLSQQEVLQHKLPFPRGERATADLAGYLPVGCLRPSFDFDDFIKRFAVRACEWIECASSHDTPPNTQFLLVIWQRYACSGRRAIAHSK
jgi:hypothetical protein